MIVTREISKKQLLSILGLHDIEGGQRANLRSADLRSANLSNADLSNADLSDKFGNAKGRRPQIQFIGLGSDNSMLTAIKCSKAVYVKRGCFTGTLSEFEAAVKKKHGSNEHGKEYAAAIRMIRLHNKLWNN